MSKTYNIIIPRPDKTGLNNVAVDLGLSAIKNGWIVNLFYLSKSEIRDDLTGFNCVRNLKISDLWKMSGVIHTHGLRPDLCGPFFKIFKKNLLLTTLHGHFPDHIKFDYKPLNLAIAWFFWSLALNFYDHRVCISNTMSRFYHRHYPKWCLNVIHNFRLKLNDNPVFNDPNFCEWVNLQRSAEKIILIYLGSLTERKNISPLVNHILSNDQISLLICGDGPLHSEINTKSKLSPRASQIYLAGLVDNPGFYLAHSDVLVLPSHAEGLPLVVIEALNKGVPCLLSNIAVHRELVALGVGDVFDRHNFSDFDVKAKNLAASRSAACDSVRVNIWNNSFSPEVGFKKYLNLINKNDGQ
jgi:glycosyltransferase involved in cell wall biosynthesis